MQLGVYICIYLYTYIDTKIMYAIRYIYIYTSEYIFSCVCIYICSTSLHGIRTPNSLHVLRRSCSSRCAKSITDSAQFGADDFNGILEGSPQLKDGFGGFNGGIPIDDSWKIPEVDDDLGVPL